MYVMTLNSKELLHVQEYLEKLNFRKLGRLRHFLPTPNFSNTHFFLIIVSTLLQIF